MAKSHYSFEKRRKELAKKKKKEEKRLRKLAKKNKQSPEQGSSDIQSDSDPNPEQSDPTETIP